MWLLNELKKHHPASHSLVCAGRAASLPGLLWSGLMDTAWKRLEDLMDDRFGCQYISWKSLIGEITGFKCRLVLSAVPVHYKKIQCWGMENTTRNQQCMPPNLSLYNNAHSYMILKSGRDTFYKWIYSVVRDQSIINDPDINDSSTELEHLRGWNIVPFPLINPCKGS